MNASIEYKQEEVVVKTVVKVPDKIKLELSIAEAILVCAVVGYTGGIIYKDNHDITFHIYGKLNSLLKLNGDSSAELVDGSLTFKHDAQKKLDALVEKVKKSI